MTAPNLSKTQEKDNPTSETTTSQNISFTRSFADIANTLDQGDKLLSQYGDFELPKVVTNLSTVVASMQTLVSLPQSKYPSNFSEFGKFVESLFKSTMIDGTVSIEEAAVIVSFLNSILEIKHITQKQMSCPICFGVISGLPTINELKSSILEVYGMCGIDTTINEVATKLDVSIRKNSPLFEDAEAKEVLLPLVKYTLTSDSTDKAIVNGKLSEKSIGALKAFIEKSDIATRFAIFPAIQTLDKSFKTSLVESFKKDISLFPHLFDSITLFKSSLFSLDEETQECLSVYMDQMYQMLPSLMDVCEESTPEKSADLVKGIVGEETLSNIRDEVEKRDSLCKNIKKLSLESFDLNAALKVGSSCLTRVCIEHEHCDTVGLDVLRNLVLENINFMTRGYRAKSINFFKGVFLK